MYTLRPDTSWASTYLQSEGRGQARGRALQGQPAACQGKGKVGKGVGLGEEEATRRRTLGLCNLGGSGGLFVAVGGEASDTGRKRADPPVGGGFGFVDPAVVALFEDCWRLGGSSRAAGFGRSRGSHNGGFGRVYGLRDVCHGWGKC